MEVKSVDKGELEQLLNFIVQETAKARAHLGKEDAEGAEHIIRYLGVITSQALQAWDLQEFVETDGEDLHEFMEEAKKAVGNFQAIEWHG